MEFPNLGEHCQEQSCKVLDFLPFKCDSCKKVFCKDHIHYFKHNCDQSSFKNKDFQIPLCPLCNQPVPYKRNELPDIVMSAHIDRDCKSDPAEERRKVFTNRCSVKGCKQKELIPFNCQKCRKNYCIRHRHENDHSCDTIVSNNSRPTSSMSSSSGNQNDVNSRRLLFFQKQQEKVNSNPNSTATGASNKNPIQPNSMSDKEALDYAIKLSLMESSKEKKKENDKSKIPADQLTEDEALARALAESEAEYNNRQNSSNTSNNDNNSDKEKCSMQ